MSNVIGLNVDRTFPVEGEMAKRVYELVMEYGEQVSVTTALGVLEMVKNQILIGINRNVSDT